MIQRTPGWECEIPKLQGMGSYDITLQNKLTLHLQRCPRTFSITLHFALANIDTSRELSDAFGPRLRLTSSKQLRLFDGASEESGLAEICVISYTAAADASAATVSAETPQFVYYTRVHASDGQNRTVVAIPSGKKHATWHLSKRHPAKAARDIYYGKSQKTTDRALHQLRPCIFNCRYDCRYHRVTQGCEA